MQLILNKPTVELMIEPVVFVDQEWLLDEVSVREFYGMDALIYFLCPYGTRYYSPYGITKASFTDPGARAALDIAKNKIFF